MLHALKVADRSLPRTGAEELATGSDLLAGRKDGLVIDFVRSAEAEAFAGAMIEGGGDLVTAFLGEAGEGGALREVLADQAVGVLVCASLPGMMRGSEVDLGAKVPLEALVAMELCPIIRGDGQNGM